MRSMKADPKMPNDNAAVSYPKKLSFESAIVGMLNGWADYAEVHERRFESKISDDYVLGPEWEQIGKGIRGLLNGETDSRLDCGTLDAFILNTLQDHGVDTSLL